MSSLAGLRSSKKNNYELPEKRYTSKNVPKYTYHKIELQEGYTEILDPNNNEQIKEITNKFLIFFNNTSKKYNLKWYLFPNNNISLEIIFLEKQKNFIFSITILDTLLSFIILHLIDFNDFETFNIFNDMINIGNHNKNIIKTIQITPITYINISYGSAEYDIPKHKECDYNTNNNTSDNIDNNINNNEEKTCEYYINGKMEKDTYEKFKLEEKLNISFKTIMDVFTNDYEFEDTILIFNIYTDIEQSTINEYSNIVFKYEEIYFILFFFEFKLIIDFFRNNNIKINIDNILIYTKRRHPEFKRLDYNIDRSVKKYIETSDNGEKYKKKLLNDAFKKELGKNLLKNCYVSLNFTDNDSLIIEMQKENDAIKKIYDNTYTGIYNTKITDTLNSLKNDFSSYFWGYFGVKQTMGGNNNNNDNNNYNNNDNNNEKFKNKYLKYKNKYLELKNSKNL